MKTTTIALLCVILFAPFISSGGVPVPGAPTIALFVNGDYVDTFDNFPAESEVNNMYISLLAKGYTVNVFTGITAGAFGDALADVDILVMPDLEIEDLASALAPDARAVISNFVSAGKCMIINGAINFSTGADEEFVNAVFGYSVTGTVDFSGSVPITSDAAGTAFEGGSTPLDANNGHYPWFEASLPPYSRSIYAYNNGSDNLTSVALIPQGAGHVIFLAWDWFDGVPNGSQDGNWDEVLRRAVEGCRCVSGTKVAEYFDSSYVDTVSDGEGEAYNLQQALLPNGYAVTTFTGTNGTDFSSGLAGADVLLMPDLELGDLGAALAPSAINEISNFVAGGKSLIIHGSFGTAHLSFLKSVFGLGLSGDPYVYTDVSSTVTPAVAGTTFAGGPVVLPGNNGMYPQPTAVFPPGARSIYAVEDFGVDYTAVSIIPMGLGRIIYLGWDWWEALPVGFQDDGWNEILLRALGQCGPTADRDADGLPDWWEILYGLDLCDNGGIDPANGSAGDPDGDRKSNKEEYLSGTHPVNAESQLFILSETRQGTSNETVTVTTEPGRRYSILKSDSLAPESWVRFSNTAVGAGTWLNTNATAALRAFVDDFTTNSSGGPAPGGKRFYAPRTRTVTHVGYYDMAWEEGNTNQVDPIVQAGFIPVKIFDVSTQELAGIQVLFVQNAVTPYVAEYTNSLGAISNAVQNGLVLIIHDRIVQDAATILPGAGGSVVFSSFTPIGNLDVVTPGTPLTFGPGGAIDNLTLDGGLFSANGYAKVASLPPDALPMLSSSDPEQIVTFAYPFGDGWVIYGTTPLDYYLDAVAPQSFKQVYAPNVIKFGAWLY